MNEWDSYAVIKGDVMELKEKWEATIRLCKRAGLMTCKLVKVEEGVDYERCSTGEFGYRLTHPRWESMIEWATQKELRLYVWVPCIPSKNMKDWKGRLHWYSNNNNNNHCDFGYIMADWSIPPAAALVVECKPITKTTLKRWSETLHMAFVTGQTECKLMMIEYHSDYEYDDENGYHLTSNRFYPAWEWAKQHHVHLSVYVPELFPRVGQFCSFGYLVAHWDVPLEYECRRPLLYHQNH